MVSLQNLDNKEVPCKIVQDRELRDVSPFDGSSRLRCGAKTSGIIVRRSRKIICKAPAVRRAARLSLAWGSWFPSSQNPGLGHPAILIVFYLLSAFCSVI